MRYFLNTIFFIIVLQLPALAQYERCQTIQYTQKILSENPNLKEEITRQNTEFEHKMHNNAMRPSTVVTIPVVFHIVYNTPEQNVPDSRILEQLEVLNNDYNRLNQDAQCTPSVFQGVAAGASIQFCLAQRDPNNNHTSGIERKQTSRLSYDIGDDMKKTALGGLKGWSKNKYLNVWVCNLSNNLLGFASMPGIANDTLDGVVISFSTVGGPDAVGVHPTYNLGRTLTHETGHWLNLIHIWGDDGNTCDGSDEVSDTPNQAGPHYGTPNFPTISCNNGPNGDMFMNFLDYTDDFGMNIFTAGQSLRMNTALSSLRAPLLTSNGCQNVVSSTDLELVKINNAEGVFCSDSIKPSVVIRNVGVTAITSIVFTIQEDSNTPQTKNWSGSLTAGQTLTIPLNAFQSTPGTHYLSVKATNTGDLNLSNNILVNYYHVQTAGTALPYSENFENKRFPSDSWKINNQDNNGTWMRTRLAASVDNASLWIYDTSTASIDDIQLEPLDLTTLTEPILAFDIAYLYDASLSSGHTLKVLASTDCGATYTEVYSRSNESLATATGSAGTLFIPSAGQWRKDSINLKNFASYKSVILKFENISGNSNSLYIDNLQVDRLAAIYPNASDINVSILQNPLRNVIHFSVLLLKSENFKVQIYDVTGRLVYKSEYQGREVEDYIHIPNLQHGVYMFRVVAGNESKAVKFIHH
ncbi:MAG: T9SS type A sorting domain-containing protein [Bacteroidetes bacterium]|jgi:hypothetical protein|nr:T9SS type A sorting domain-containing protein [Bacteroidota bacterium]